MFISIISSKGIILLCVLVFLFLIIVSFIDSDYDCLQLKCEETCDQNESDSRTDQYMSVQPWEVTLDFENFNNESGTPDGRYIVPNYVHFIKFGQSTFSFVQCVCILAALKNQRPEKLFFHTNVDSFGFHGKYWNVLMNTPGFKEALVIVRMKVPTMIFNHTLNAKWKYYHGGDVARMMIMMKYGGIYLDSDSYIIRSLDDFRRYEMTLGWLPGRDMGNQIVLAHKDARFLKLWYESYKDNYDPTSWYYNAGTYPTTNILDNKPELVHRVQKLFGNYGIKWKVYMTMFPEWHDYYGMHLLSSRLYRGLANINQNAKYPVVFNEVNVLNYPVAFRSMCLEVYPFPKNS